MGLVSVGVPAGAGIGRNFDLRKTLFRLLHRRFVVVRIDQQLKVWRHVLTLLGQHIVDVRIHPVIRIAHRLLPQRLLVGRQCAGFALGAVDGGEMHQQITEQVQHAAGIFLAKAPQRSISAARIERENRFQMRRILLGREQLFGAEAGNADHPDIAVAPWLLRDPFDEIVAVPLPRTAAIRFADAARRTDDVDIAARDKELGVAGFERAGPERRPCRLRRQRIRHIRPLQVLVVDRKRQQRRKLAAVVGPIDVD